MRVTIDITAVDMDDLRTQLLNWCKAFGVQVNANQMELPLKSTATPSSKPSLHSSPEISDTVNPAEKPKRRAGRAEAKMPETLSAAKMPEGLSLTNLSESSPTPLPTEVTPTVATKDMARAALEELNNKKGVDAARKVLKGLGFGRWSEVKEDKYGELLSACKAELA